MIIWEETQRQSQETLQRLYVSTGLGTPLDPPEGAGRRGRSFPAEAAEDVTFTRCMVSPETSASPHACTNFVNVLLYINAPVTKILNLILGV